MFRNLFRERCNRTVLMLFLLLQPLLALAEEDGLQGNASAGQAAFQKRACSVCHSINGTGGMVGPDLTQVGIRRSETWLLRWLEDPSEILPGTAMPVFEWESEQEIQDIIAYLVRQNQPVDTADILKTTPVEEAGRKLVAAYDCRACHRIVTGGRTRYPDLTHVGSKIYPEWEIRWLQDPQAIKPGTYMPTFSLTPREREAIAAYLHTLK